MSHKYTRPKQSQPEIGDGLGVIFPVMDESYFDTAQSLKNLVRSSAVPGVEIRMPGEPRNAAIQIIGKGLVGNALAYNQANNPLTRPKVPTSIVALTLRDTIPELRTGIELQFSRAHQGGPDKYGGSFVVLKPALPDANMLYGIEHRICRGIEFSTGIQINPPQKKLDLTVGYLGPQVRPSVVDAIISFWNDTTPRTINFGPAEFNPPIGT